MKLFYISLFAITFTVNSFSQNFLKKNAGNCFSLEVPSYMAKTFDLNDVASLQYSNIIKEAYTIVIEDSKDELNSLNMIFQDPKEFLENFTVDYQLESTNRTISEITEFKSNENLHAQVEMTCGGEDADFYMIITCVETKDHFYKILCWTILENKDVLKNDYLIISKSLVD